MMQFKSQLGNILYQAVLRFKYAQSWLSSALPWLASPKERAEIILHIGAPKTGTSAIQRFCLRNRLALLRAGFYYPEHGIDKNGVSGGHFLICQPGASGTVAGVELLQIWLATAKKANLTLLLSSENFYVRASELWLMLQGEKVRVIGWYRDPLEAIVSNYNQEVKRHFLTQTLDARCRRIVGSRTIHHFDGQHLHAWADAAGESQCHFYPFSYSAALPIEQSFLEAIGIKASKASRFNIDRALINRSYAPDALELKRRLNLLLTREDVELNRLLDVFLQAYSDQSAHATLSDSMTLSTETSQQLQAHFAQVQAALLQRFPALSPVLRQRADRMHTPHEIVSVTDLQRLWDRLASTIADTAHGLRQRLHGALEANKSAGLHEVTEVIVGEPSQAEPHAAPLSERG